MSDFVITQQQVGLSGPEPHPDLRRFDERLLREHHTVMMDQRRYTDPKTPYERYHERRHWRLNGDPQPEPEPGLSRLVFRAREAHRKGQLQYTVPEASHSLSTVWSVSVNDFQAHSESHNSSLSVEDPDTKMLDAPPPTTAPPPTPTEVPPPAPTTV